MIVRRNRSLNSFEINEYGRNSLQGNSDHWEILTITIRELVLPNFGSKTSGTHLCSYKCDRCGIGCSTSSYPQCPTSTTFIMPNPLNTSYAMQMKIQLNILWSSVPPDNSFGIPFFKAFTLNFCCNWNIYGFFFVRSTLHLCSLFTKSSICLQSFHPSYSSFGTFTGNLSFKTFLINCVS